MITYRSVRAHTHTQSARARTQTRSVCHLAHAEPLAVPCNYVQAVLPSRQDQVRAPTETNMRTNEYAVTEIPR